MKLLITSLFIIILIFSGCATTKESCCPPKDVVIVVPIGDGLLPIGINKGLLDEQYEDDYWIDAEKYDKMMEEKSIEEEDETESI